jgi:glycosyltransferase involved in cell wall biosynthesis
MGNNLDLTVIIPALNEGPNLAILLPRLRQRLFQMGITWELLIVTTKPDNETQAAASQHGAQIVEQSERGYGGALCAGFAKARGAYCLTMDADISHDPAFIDDMWANRRVGDVVIASRYIIGGRAKMPASRRLLSQILNLFFSRGLSLPIRDMSSGFRLYKTQVVQGQPYEARDFDILQEILVRAYAEGWRVREIPFAYAPRQYGSSHARVFRFGLAYLRTFWSLWTRRNSILAADYDDRAYDSIVFLQRYWQRSRFRHVVELSVGEGRTLDVGCGSSRILGALRPDSLAVDILHPKLRYAKKFARTMVQGSGLSLPFGDGTFPCVVCSQVIEHIPRESSILTELDRVLAPGGRLVLGTPDYSRWEWVFMEMGYGLFAPGGYADEHITHYTARQLIDYFEKKGFVVEAKRYILRGELILALRKGSKPLG